MALGYRRPRAPGDALPAGVLCLVSLSCPVIRGPVAQDRIALTARRRIPGRAVHRTTAAAPLAFPLPHITTRIVLDRTEPVAAAVPFSLGVTGGAGLIGLGSLAGLLMLFVGVTGPRPPRPGPPSAPR
ncbi:hypothetical protein [Streptomyces glaucus]|uniref:Secreted protein n=1 Tax=Streptomyces glaucus TaxID=284029 RepID=A0ABP5WSQ7_9ACTN